MALKLTQELMTYVHEALELRIVRHLIVDPVRCDWVIRDVLHVRLPEVKHGIVDRSGNASNDGVLVALGLVQLLEHPPMVRMRLRVIVEHLLDELLQPVAWDDRQVHLTQWSHIHLSHGIRPMLRSPRRLTYHFDVFEITDVVHFTLDNFEGDAS